MNDRSSPECTFLAWLTPPGTAALATFALRGPQAWQLVKQLFQPASGRPLPDLPAGEPHRFWLGWLGEAAGNARDQVVLALQRGGATPWVEVHCHGGRQLARMLEESFVSRGARLCSWQELEVLTGNEPGKARALAALAQAPTLRTANILLDQYHGAWERAIAAAVASLEGGQLHETAQILDRLSCYSALGQHLTAPWRVAILGAPNVGKSSLANRLAGYERSIVSPTPGTTRDAVTTSIAVDGWPIELVDTAGWRESLDKLEQQGIELARAVATTADLCLWLVDASAPPCWPTAPLPRTHFVVNKIDLAPVWDLSQAPPAARISALTGAGMPELLEALSHWLVPEPPPTGAAVPFTPELAECVQQARQMLQAGQPREAAAALQGSAR
jgi:tRNA modification GTPase